MDGGLPGYDALDVEEIVAVLGDADLATIKKVRAYERKFANRPAVLDEVVRVHHRAGQAGLQVPIRLPADERLRDGRIRRAGRQTDGEVSHERLPNPRRR